MAKRSFPLSKVYGLLEPGPVVLLTTARKGLANVMTMSWHTMLEFEPPLVGCVVSDRNFSFAALKATRQCVLNIPTEKLAARVVACGNHSGSSVAKFTAFGLTPIAAALIDLRCTPDRYPRMTMPSEQHTGCAQAGSGFLSSTPAGNLPAPVPGSPAAVAPQDNHDLGLRLSPPERGLHHRTAPPVDRRSIGQVRAIPVEMTGRRMIRCRRRPHVH